MKGQLTRMRAKSSINPRLWPANRVREVRMKLTMERMRTKRRIMKMGFGTKTMAPD